MAWRSVGKPPRWVTIVLRSGRSRSAAPTALNHITVVLSPTTTWPGATPMRGAMRSPTVTGRSHQPAFQPPMSSSSHCCTRERSVSAVPEVGGPSEFPSR